MLSYFNKSSNDVACEAYKNQIADLLFESKSILEPHDVLLHLLKKYNEENEKSYFNRDGIFRVRKIISLIELTKDLAVTTDKASTKYSFEKIITDELNTIDLKLLPNNSYFLRLLKTFLEFYPHYTVLINSELTALAAPTFLLLSPVDLIREAAPKLYINQELDNIARKTYDFIKGTHDPSYSEASFLKSRLKWDAKISCQIISELAEYIPADLYQMITDGLINLHDEWEGAKTAAAALQRIDNILPVELITKIIVKLARLPQHRFEATDSMNYLIKQHCSKFQPDFIKSFLSTHSLWTGSAVEITLTALCEHYPANDMENYIAQLLEELQNPALKKQYGRIRILTKLIARITDNDLKIIILASIANYLTGETDFDVLFAAIALSDFLQELNNPAITEQVLENFHQGLNSNNSYIYMHASHHLIKLLPVLTEEGIETVIKLLIRHLDVYTLSHWVHLATNEMKIQIYRLVIPELDGDRYRKFKTLEFIMVSSISIPDDINTDVIEKLFSMFNTADEYNNDKLSEIISNALFSCISSAKNLSIPAIITRLFKLCFNSGPARFLETYTAALTLRKLKPLLNDTDKSMLVDNLINLYFQSKERKLGFISWILEVYTDSLLSMDIRKDIVDYYINQIRTCQDSDKRRITFELSHIASIIPKQSQPALIKLLLAQLKENHCDICPKMLLLKLVQQMTNHSEEYALVAYFVMAYRKYGHDLSAAPGFVNTYNQLREYCTFAPHVSYHLQLPNDLTRIIMEYRG